MYFVSVIVQLKENFKALLMLKNDCQEIFDQYQASIFLITFFPTSYNSNILIITLFKSKAVLCGADNFL